MSALPPGPPTRRFLDTWRWLRTPQPWLEGMAARYGNAFTLQLPRVQGPVVVFAEPAAVKDLWTGDPLQLHAGQANAILRSILGKDSLLVLDGERHLAERRLMLPPFHGDRMRAYGEAMREAASREIDRWPLGRAFPVHAAAQAITLDVIMRTIFGVGGDDPRLAPLRDALVKWTTLGTSRLGTAILLLTPPERAEQLWELSTSRPWGRLLPWAKIVRARLETDRLVRELIAARRREPATTRGGRDDILSMLLEARDDTGAAMTDDQLRDEMLTLLLAGHETTATTLAWTIHHLLEHPQWLARVRAEVREQGDKSPLLDAAIKETLRLTPIIPMVGRVLGKPTTIGGYDLPAGAFALAAIYLVHRRADLWPDPTRFDPERFLNKKIDPSTYFPFGGGARRCLGMAFASYEMKIVLATILARTELSPAAGARVRLVRRGITFAPSGGMPVVMTARS